MTPASDDGRIARKKDNEVSLLFAGGCNEVF